MSRWDYYGDYFPPSIPLPARGGIRARSRKGDFAASWWGRRWITVLESFDLRSRLTRGRSYARRGQVLHLEIAKGNVTATVQGSRPNPYAVTIGLKEIAATQRHKVAKAIAANMAIAAKLMAGELPVEVEACFSRAGAPLFPARARDLTTSCSCPDFSNPCKHIAAVYYLLAEEFDRDPFLLFRLRGVGRDELTALLGEAASKTRRTARVETMTRAAPASQPLAADPERFWRGRPLHDELYGGVQISDDAAPLARRLGNFPFWRGEIDFLESISSLSSRAAQQGLEVFLGRH
jgi:uncharacterized Zn finger protein